MRRVIAKSRLHAALLPTVVGFWYTTSIMLLAWSTAIPICVIVFGSFWLLYPKARKVAVRASGTRLQTKEGKDAGNG